MMKAWIALLLVIFFGFSLGLAEVRWGEYVLTPIDTSNAITKEQYDEQRYYSQIAYFSDPGYCQPGSIEAVYMSEDRILAVIYAESASELKHLQYWVYHQTEGSQYGLDIHFIPLPARYRYKRFCLSPDGSILTYQYASDGTCSDIIGLRTAEEGKCFIRLYQVPEEMRQPEYHLVHASDAHVVSRDHCKLVIQKPGEEPITVFDFSEQYQQRHVHAEWVTIVFPLVWVAIMIVFFFSLEDPPIHGPKRMLTKEEELWERVAKIKKKSPPR